MTNALLFLATITYDNRVDACILGLHKQLMLKIADGEHGGPIHFDMSKGKRSADCDNIVIFCGGYATYDYQKRSFKEFSE